MWVLGCSWIDFGGFQGGLGRVLEVPGPHFSSFFARASFQCEKACDVQKPQFFLGFSRFFTYRKLAARAKKRHKIAPGAFRTQLPTKIVLKTRFGGHSAGFWKGLRPSWPALWRHLAGFWALLGSSWALLSASWAFLGWSWAPLARI